MSELTFTGERYVPGLDWPDISYEHWHRYLYAAEFAAGKQVLDVACGEGYGSGLLAETADRVLGIDIDPQIVEFAASKYQRANLEFRCGPAHALPVSEGDAFDLVVSFETLEHMAEEHQRRFLSEAKRLLKPDGVLLVSTPNKLLYTDEPAYSNPFHVKELYRAEFLELLQRYFRAVKIFGQMVYPVSYIWPAAAAAATSEHQLVFSRGCFTPVKGDEKQMRYMLAVCSDVEQSAHGSVLLDLSHRLTGRLQEHISVLDGSIERLKTTLDEHQAAADVRAREQEALAARIAALDLEAAGAAARTSKLTDDVAARDEMIRGLQGRLQSQDQQLLNARAEATAVNKRVKALESELAGRKTSIVQLRQTIGMKDLAMARARKDLAFHERAVGSLQVQVEELRRRHDELLAAMHRRESEAARLQAVIEERTALIQRLEAASSRRDDAMRALEQELAARPSWGSRTVEELIAAHITRSSDVIVQAVTARLGQPPALPPAADRQHGATAHQAFDGASPHREPPLSPAELPATTGVDLPVAASIGEDDGSLALMERALEAERSERQRLEGVVKQGYTQLKVRITEAVDRLVPRKATVVVVSKGDEDLLRLNGRPAWHFPQSETAAYAGHYPADSAAAIDHIETLRAKGAQFLVFPATSAWWLEHYSEFADHLSRRYRRILQRDDVGVVFDLRRARQQPHDWKTDFSSAIEEFQASFRRDPAILDCHSGLDLARSFPQYAVFSPPDDGPALPYLDSTIDVTVCGAGSPVARDARRVATALLLTATVGPNGTRRSSGGVRLRAEWLAQKRAGSSLDVSIIIPCHNGPGLTQSCLAAVEATLPSSLHTEVIVVDDASTDGTRAMLTRWKETGHRLRVLRNSRNLGFLRSCNRAARAAKGEIIVLLNNDTRPAPGWLTALLRTFAEYPDAGAVGGKLVFPDGTLQEAGSLVFRDGSAANFGRGDRNPDHPLFNYVRQVDYCSAALLATPRRLFLELEGFDPRYVPAYYEDTDYCFKLHDKGHRVYYQPAATVIHHEGASCGTDLTRGVKQHQVVNREKFCERWKSALQRQPERPPHEDFDAWQRLAVRSVNGGTT